MMSDTQVKYMNQSELNYHPETNLKFVEGQTDVMDRVIIL